MAKYRLKKEHYLQDKATGMEPQAYEAGAEVNWPGQPSLHMEPIDQEAKERVEARHADFSERRKKAMSGRASVGWGRTFEQNMVNIITREAVKPDAPAVAEAGSGRKRKAA